LCITAKLSEGTNLLDCEAGFAGEVTTASATGWRRAQPGANNKCTNFAFSDIPDMISTEAIPRISDIKA